MTFTIWHIIGACVIVAVIAAVIATIRTRQKDIKKVAYMMDALEDGELNFRFQDKNKFNRTLNRIRTIFEKQRQAHEQDSWVYDRMAKEAREEGFEEIALKFEMVGAIEKEHEARYRKLLKNIEDKKVFSKDGEAIWQCSNCGHIVIGKNAPEVCPVCNHPQSYFQVLAQNY